MTDASQVWTTVAQEKSSIESLRQQMLLERRQLVQKNQQVNRLKKKILEARVAGTVLPSESAKLVEMATLTSQIDALRITIRTLRGQIQQKSNFVNENIQFLKDEALGGTPIPPSTPDALFLTALEVSGSSKLNDVEVTTLQLPGLDASKITTGEFPTARIANAAINESKLASNAVTTAKIPDGAIATAKIADNAVTNEKIVSVDASKITGTLPSSEIEIYTDSDESNTSFPVGSYLYAVVAPTLIPLSRNSPLIIRIDEWDTRQYRAFHADAQETWGGDQLSGSWNARGLKSFSVEQDFGDVSMVSRTVTILVQRTA